MVAVDLPTVGSSEKTMFGGKEFFRYLSTLERDDEVDRMIHALTHDPQSISRFIGGAYVHGIAKNGPVEATIIR